MQRGCLWVDAAVVTPQVPSLTAMQRQPPRSTFSFLTTARNRGVLLTGNPKHEKNRPQSSASMQSTATALLLPRAPCLQCVHQLLLEIETSTCHLRKPATYRGLIKSPK